ARAASRVPPPASTSTPVARDTATPLRPARSRLSSTARPTRPDAPTTATLIRPCVHASAAPETSIGAPPELGDPAVERLARELRLVRRPGEDRHLGAEVRCDDVADGDEGMAAQLPRRRGDCVPGAARDEHREPGLGERRERDLGLVRRALAHGAAHRPAGGVVQALGRTEVEAPRVQETL